MNRFWQDEHGAVSIEYGFIITFVVLGIIVSLQSMGQTVNGWFAALAPAFGGGN